MSAANNHITNLEDRLQARKVSDFIANVRTAALGTFGGALIILPIFVNEQNINFWAAWFCILFLFDGLRLSQSFSYDSNATDKRYIRRHIIVATVLAMCCGFHWMIGFVIMWDVAQTGGEYLILCVLAAGVMSTALLQYRHMKFAANMLLTPCMLASFGIALFYPPQVALPIVLMTMLHGFIILSGISDHARFYRERFEQQFELERSEQTVRLLLHEYEASGSDWLWETDAAGRLIDVSPRFSEAAGRSAEELEGSAIVSLFAEGPQRDSLEHHFASCQSFRDVMVEVAGCEKETWWSISAKPLENGAMRGVLSDVTSQMLADQKLSRMARSDSLTGLANRLRFNEHLLDICRDDSSERALLFIDLDNFKIVNDTLGHDAGDDLLRSVAHRIVRETGTDGLTARLGGDEFAVITREDFTLEQSHELAERIITALCDPFKTAGRSIRVSASIGIAHEADTALMPEDWMRRADLALYAAKDGGRSCYRDYNAQLHELERNRRELELDMRTALADGQFVLVFQKQLDIATGKPSGMEALIRWNHPKRGVIMPDQFIHIAEESGLIVPLGEWIVREALRQAAGWQDSVTIALNLSPVQIRSQRLVTVLAQELAATGIDPKRIELEVTESTLLHDTKENVETLHKLRALGVRIALDDFGTGYSSLSYLRTFPFDTIKIDRSFVNELTTRADCQAIIKAIVDLARELEMKTIAEGIEEREQFEWLKAAGCTTAQGYYISRPLSFDDAANDLVDRQVLANSATVPSHSENDGRNKIAASG